MPPSANFMYPYTLGGMSERKSGKQGSKEVIKWAREAERWSDEQRWKSHLTCTVIFRNCLPHLVPRPPFHHLHRRRPWSLDAPKDSDGSLRHLQCPLLGYPWYPFVAIPCWRIFPDFCSWFHGRCTLRRHLNPTSITFAVGRQAHQRSGGWRTNQIITTKKKQKTNYLYLKNTTIKIKNLFLCYLLY